MSKLKKYVPFILATIRAISFVPIILSTFNILPVSLLSQILLTTIIMVSDKFDGEISRKNNNEKDKLRFRIFDTAIDKTGIVLCLIGLLFTKKIPIHYAATILGYNSILLGTGTINLLTTKDKKEATVQGLFISRLFTALTGLSFILLNNIEISNLFQNLLTIGMGTLGISSLGTQLVDKIKQKKNYNGDNKSVTQEEKKMNKLNISRGLVASKAYLRKLESSIEPAYFKNQPQQNEQLKDLESYEVKFVENIGNRLNNLENYLIDESTQRKAYQTSMKGDSRRIRPLLLFLGNLCGNGNVGKNTLISSGMSIEMIHKMSLILDDYFDGDLTRRGNPTFHTIYDERTMLETTNLLLKLSNNIFLNGINNLPIDQQKKLLELYKQIIVDMGTGFIEDLDRKEKSISLEDAYRINDLQSTTILRNSLLIGYSLSSGIIKEDDTYLGLQRIGATMGKTFQGFNDIENFLSEEIQSSNKGNLYSDLKANRKNIILGQVPKELFYPPYTAEDVLEYIRINGLIDSTIEELSSGIVIAKKEIDQLSSPVARDTLLYATNKITEKTLKKIKNNRQLK